MATLILRPSGVGSNTELADNVDGDQYLAVNEEVADDYTTYINRFNSTNFAVSTYQIDSGASGTINKITFYGRARTETAGDVYKPAFYINDTLYYGDLVDLTSTFTLYSQEFADNPDTSAAWTWEDLASSEIGVSMKSGSFQQTMCTQIYIEVDYEPAENITQINIGDSWKDISAMKVLV